MEVAGYQLPAPPLLDNFLYLCAHGAVHFWSRLFWLADLAEIMRGNPGIDWQALMALAGEAGMMPLLALGVILAHELLDAPLPEAIRTYALQDQVVFYSIKVACRIILCPQPLSPPLPLILQKHVCCLKWAHSFKEKLNFLQNICLGADWQLLSLPDSLFFFYYLLRFPLWLQRRLGGRRNQMVRHETTYKDGA